jgi:hypothetical protein
LKAKLAPKPWSRRPIFPASSPRAPFDFGRTLSRAFSLLSRNFAPFLGISVLLVGLPLAVLGGLQIYLLRSDPKSAATTAFTAMSILSALLTLVSGALLQSAVIYGAVNDWNGQRAPFSATLSAAFNRILPLIGVSILVGLATAFAALLFVIPGILVALAYAVATPVVVMEPNRGVFGSLTRSADLTRNHRWSIFGILLVILVLTIALAAIIGALSSIFSPLTPGLAFGISQVVVQPLTQAISTLIGAVVAASIYYELRTIKEGVGAEVMASVFD